jgi:hypothetical protein
MVVTLTGGNATGKVARLAPGPSCPRPSLLAACDPPMHPSCPSLLTLPLHTLQEDDPGSQQEGYEGEGLPEGEKPEDQVR